MIEKAKLAGADAISADAASAGEPKPLLHATRACNTGKFFVAG